MTHWRRSPAALRALARWVRLAVFTLAALLAFILLAYAIHGAAAWD